MGNPAAALPAHAPSGTAAAPQAPEPSPRVGGARVYRSPRQGEPRPRPPSAHAPGSAAPAPGPSHAGLQAGSSAALGQHRAQGGTRGPRRGSRGQRQRGAHARRVGQQPPSPRVTPDPTARLSPAAAPLPPGNTRPGAPQSTAGRPPTRPWPRPYLWAGTWLAAAPRRRGRARRPAESGPARRPPGKSGGAEPSGRRSAPHARRDWSVAGRGRG